MKMWLAMGRRSSSTDQRYAIIVTETTKTANSAKTGRVDMAWSRVDRRSI